MGESFCDKGWYTYDVHFEGGWGWGKNEILLGVGGGGLTSVLEVQSFFYQRNLDLLHDQTLSWAKHYIIDKKLSFWLWRQIVKPSFNDTIALFVG